jgi:lysophospholipase L1-like esterase
MKPFRSRFAAAVLGCLLLATPSFAQNILVKDGEKIAFMGDSITQFGAVGPSGYVNMVMTGLAANGIKAKAIPAGISGQTSVNMLARTDALVAQKPDWMTLSCGVNDVWHGARGGVPLEDYKTNIRQIVEKALAGNVKVVILTATMIHEDPKDPLNVQLVDYNNFLKDLAKEKNLPLADLNADMQAEVASMNGGNPSMGLMVTKDGVHMNPFGDVMMATGVLKAFGLNDDQLAKAHAAFMKVQAPVPFTLPLGVLEQLRQMAMAQKKTVEAVANDQIGKAVPAAK